MKKIIITLFSALLAASSFAALTVINVYPTNITSTSAYFGATISATNGTGGTTGIVFYGTTDGSTDISAWVFSNVYGAVTIQSISKQITGLTQSQKYFYRWRLTEGSSNNWASGTSNFWTKAASPTSTPAVVTISVQSDTNGNLKAPTNFFKANTGLLMQAVSQNPVTNFTESDPHLSSWLSTNEYVKSNSGNWAGKWQGTDPADYASAGAVNVISNQADTARAIADGLNSRSNIWNGAAVTSVAAKAIADGLNSRSSTWDTVTDKGDNSALISVSNVVNGLNGRSSVWDKAATDGVTATNGVYALQGATNDLNGRVITLEGGGTVSGWSGYNATQEVTWAYSTTVVYTNIVVTGSGLNPNVAGTYTYSGVNGEGYKYWACTNGNYIYVPTLVTPQYTIYTQHEGLPGGNDFFYKSSDNENPVGNYEPYAPYGTGTPVAVYSFVTNLNTWKAGPAPADGQAWKLTLGGTNIYRAYASSNVFDKPLYGNGSGLTGLDVPSTNTIIADYTNRITLTSNAFVLADSVITNRITIVSNMVDTLNTSTGTLNTAVGNLNTSTNALNTRMGNAETSTNTLNTRVGNLETSTNALNTAMTLTITNAAVTETTSNATWLAGRMLNIAVKTNYATSGGTTNVFAGIGTTGLVGSGTSDTNGLLYYNGTWLPTTNVTTATSNLFVRINGATAMTGDLNMGGKAITNCNYITQTNKINVLATINNGQLLTNTIATVTNYTEIADATSSFNPVSGVFTAYRACNLIFISTGMIDPTSGEIDIYLYDGSTSIRSMPGSCSEYGSGYSWNISTCVALTNGANITLRLRSNLGGSIYNNGQYIPTLSIIEP